MRVVSADRVVPVEGEPIRDGAVAIDDGTIAAVGRTSELGAGERFEQAVILPGFVNAHSHLEYAVYAAFGDGLPFPDWIGLHVVRKARIDVTDMEAIARLGALECLRSGITAVGDCSFSGAAAVGCADVGLRAIVYLEVFGSDPVDQIERRFGILTRDTHGPCHDGQSLRFLAALSRSRVSRANGIVSRRRPASAARSSLSIVSMTAV